MGVCTGVCRCALCVLLVHALSVLLLHVLSVLLLLMSQLMRMEARTDKFPGRQMSEEGVWRERVAAAEK